MATQLKLDLQSSKKLNLSVDEKTSFDLRTATPVSAGTTNYERLANLPQINDVTVIGNKSLLDLKIVSENTTAGWAEQPTYVPRAGEIIVYTDHTQTTDEQGNTIDLPDVKIGDGSAYVVDLPFISDGSGHSIMELLEAHIANNERHISQTERNFWNEKLNCDLVGEELIFNRN